MGSDSNNAGAINNKNQRNTRKRQKTTGPYPHSPNPRIWWIRIKLTLQERWIDPDPSGSWSTLRIKGTWTGSWVDPTQRAYKRGKNPYSLISIILFSLSSPPFPFLANPKPNFSKSTQKWLKHGLNGSYHYSKHESFKGITSLNVEQRESLSFSSVGSNRSYSLLFFCWNRCKTMRFWFDSHSLWILKTFLWFLERKVLVRFRVWIERFGSTDSRCFELCSDIQWNVMKL